MGQNYGINNAIIGKSQRRMKLKTSRVSSVCCITILSTLQKGLPANATYGKSMNEKASHCTAGKRCVIVKSICMCQLYHFSYMVIESENCIVCGAYVVNRKRIAEKTV